LSFQTLEDLITYAQAANWRRWEQIAASYHHGSQSAEEDDS
jgi:hypothetical protein